MRQTFAHKWKYLFLSLLFLCLSLPSIHLHRSIYIRSEELANILGRRTKERKTSHKKGILYKHHNCGVGNKCCFFRSLSPRSVSCSLSQLKRFSLCNLFVSYFVLVFASFSLSLVLTFLMGRLYPNWIVLALVVAFYSYFKWTKKEENVTLRNRGSKK